MKWHSSLNVHPGTLISSTDAAVQPGTVYENMQCCTVQFSAACSAGPFASYSASCTQTEQYTNDS